MTTASTGAGYARRAILPMANVLLGALFGLLSLKLMTLYMTTDVYGEFQYALAAVGLIFLFTDLQLGDAHTKRVSEGMPAGDCFRTYAWFRVVSSLVFVSLTFGGLFLYTVVLGRQIEDLAIATIVSAVCYYVGKSIQQTATATFDARLETARSQLGGFVETLVRTGIIVLVAALFTSTIPFVGHISASGPITSWVRAHPAAAIGLAWTAGSLAASVVLFVYLLRSIEPGRFRWDILRSYFAFSLPLLLPSSMALIALFIDRVMLGFFGTNVNTAGFAAPRQIVGVIEGAALAVGIVLFPAISAMAASGEADGTRSVMKRSSRYMSLVLMPGIAFLFFFPGPILDLATNEEISGNGLVLSVLAVMIYFLVLARPMLDYLKGHARTREAATAGILAAGLTILLNLILVPDDIKSLHLKLFGLKALGAAIATLAGTLAAFLYMSWATRARDGSPTERVAYWKHIVAGAALGGAIWLAERATGIEMHRWYTILAFAILGGLAYVIALLALREITREDIHYVRQVLHVGEMAKYLRSELLGEE